MEGRAGRTGAARAAAVAAQLADRITDAVPGLTVAAEADRVVLSGRGLARRAVTDPLLRDLGSWVR
jgi:alpha-beta hydrolase superfamily lysophospholipase